MISCFNLKFLLFETSRYFKNFRLRIKTKKYINFNKQEKKTASIGSEYIDKKPKLKLFNLTYF